MADTKKLMTLEQGQEEEGAFPVDAKRDSFPLCIVWTPLPLFTWIIPFIGHLGIVTSEGMIHDFAGSYFVNKDPHLMGFGTVTKYWRISLADINNPGTIKEGAAAWDKAIETSSNAYDGMMHNLICNNCHSHVSMCLNQLQFKGSRNWNTLFMIIYMVLFGKYVSWTRIIKTWIGFVVIAGIIIVSVIISKV